jgi:hypothetical protein
MYGLVFAGSLVSLYWSYFVAMVVFDLLRLLDALRSMRPAPRMGFLQTPGQSTNPHIKPNLPPGNASPLFRFLDADVDTLAGSLSGSGT